MKKWIVVFSALAFSLSACGGKDTKKKMEDKLKAEEARKADAKKKNDEADAKRFAPAPEEKVALPSPYNDGDSTPLAADAACPEGIWSLFKDTPGADKAEKKANDAKRGELAKDLRSKQFLVKLRAPDQVKLGAFDAPKGEFPLEVQGKIECSDSFGHVTIAWTAAKAGDGAASAVQEGAEVLQNEWMAPPVSFAVPMKTMAEAKTWADANRISMKARVVLKLGKVEIDHKLKKVSKVTEKVQGQTLSIGGGTEDWGAGRLVRAELVGLRVATNHEKDQLFEKKP